jgi:choloylglycine hydrolase
MRQSGRRVIDYTRWTTVSDLAHLRFYFQTYEDSSIRMVDQIRFDLDAKELKTIPMTSTAPPLHWCG